MSETWFPDADLLLFARGKYGEKMGEWVAAAFAADPDNETKAGNSVRRSLTREIESDARKVAVT